MSEPTKTASLPAVKTAPVPAERALIPMKERGIQLTSLEDAVRFCKYVAASGIGSGAGCDSAEKALVLIQAGMEAGLSPMASFRALYVMDSAGRINLGWRGTGALAAIRRSGVCKLEPTPRWEGEEGTDEWRCIIRSQRHGWAKAEETVYSVADAKRAKLWGKTTRSGNPTPWITDPGTMLMWRAVGKHANTYYSDVLLGYPLLEVMRDDTDLSDVTPIPRGRGPGHDPLLDAAAGPILDVTPSAGLEPIHPVPPHEAAASTDEAGSEPAPADPPWESGSEAVSEGAAPALEPKVGSEARPAPPPPRTWRDDPRFQHEGDEGPMGPLEQKRLMELLRERKIGPGRSAAFLSRIVGRQLARPGELTCGEFYYVLGALAPESLPKDRQPEQGGLWPE